MSAAAPSPYETVEVGSITGFHQYIVDRNKRKIAAVWGPMDQKVWTAALFAAAPKMLAALQQAEEYFDNRADVKDGSYGVPEPNTEMTILSEIQAAIHKATGAEP